MSTHRVRSLALDGPPMAICWMPRTLNGRARQAGIGHAAPQFAVDEIADAAGGQPERHQRGDEVGDVPPVQAMFVRPQSHGDQNTEEAAVEAHAALPDGEDLQRIGQEISWFVEQYLAQSPAQNDAEHAVKKEVVELLNSQEARAMPDPVAPEPNELNESHQIHQTIPAHGERADRKGDRVELWVKKHRRRRVG
jgi:hypothetical protein